MKSTKTLIILIALSLSYAAGIVAYSLQAEILLKMMIIYLLIGISAIISIIIAIKKMKEEKEGQPLEDEFNQKLKYKAGDLAYISSLYIWLFLFLFKGFFPDVETLIGGGILLSALAGFITKFLVKKNSYGE